MAVSSSLISKNIVREETHRYLHTSMVSHRGVPVSLAMRDDGRIFYSVLDMSDTEGGTFEEGADRSNDKNFWSKVGFGGDYVSMLMFPTEIVQVGYAVAPNFQIDKYDHDNLKIVDRLDAAGKPLDATGRLLSETTIRNRTNYFYSSTARLGAKVPFQALSDGKYIYIFRQSIAANDPNNTTPAIVNNTLLVDRFILSGSVLKLSREIRYQRSRHKTEPESRKDTLSPVDIEGNSFYEPTRELLFADNLSNGSFSVLLIPGTDAETQRWQIFTTNLSTKKVNSFSIRFDYSLVFDTSDSEQEVKEFIAKYDLGDNLIPDVQALIRLSKTDEEIASGLLTYHPGKDVPEDAFAEMIYSLRLGVSKDDFVLSSESEWPLMEYNNPVTKDSIKSEYLTAGGALKPAYQFKGTPAQLKPLASMYTPSNGLSSCYYHQSEMGEDGKPIKNKACVMLASGLQDKQGNKYIGILNFAVAATGRLSQLTTEVVNMPDINVQALDQTPFRNNLAALAKVAWQGPQKMSLLDIDPNGFSTSGGVLKFGYSSEETGISQGYSDAVSATSPHLFDDSLGRVNLYFKGAKNNFFVLYFNPSGSRGVEVKDTASNIVEPPLALQSRLDRDMTLAVQATLPVGVNTCTLEMRSTQPDPVVESWKKLPRSLGLISGILNGKGALALGALDSLGKSEDALAGYLKPSSGNGSIRIRTAADNKLIFQTQDAFSTHVVDGKTHSLALSALSDFLAGNRSLEIAQKAFSLTDHVTLDADYFHQAFLAPLVSDAGDIGKLWRYLIARGILLDPGATITRARLMAPALSGTESSLRAVFTDVTLNSLSLALLSEGNTADKSARRAGLKQSLIALILDVAKVRIVTFTVNDDNPQKVDRLGAGLAVSVSYNYATNFVCTPANLDGKSASKWEHLRSYLFNCSVNQDAITTADTEITTAYNYRYAINNTIGQWEDLDASLALQLKPASETDGAAAFTVDTHQLRALQPSVKGLSVEAWIKPSTALSATGMVVSYQKDGRNYALGIEKDSPGTFRCVALLAGKKHRSKSSFPFSQTFPDGQVQEWRHLAFSHRKYWGYRLEANQTIHCGIDNSLHLTGEFTLEALLKIDADGPIVSKAGEYSLSVAGGKVAFTVGANNLLAGNPLKISTGTFYKLTLIRSLQKPQTEPTKVEYPITGKDSTATTTAAQPKWYEGKSNDQMIKGMAEKQDQMESSMDISRHSMLGGVGSQGAAKEELNPDYYYTLIITDGQNSSQEWTSPNPQSTEIVEAYKDFLMGGGSFRGTFASVRVWNRALALKEAKALVVAENKAGLLSHWRMTEGDGKYLYDDLSENHGVASDGSWTDSPQPNLPGYFQFYVNGTPEQSEASVDFAPLGVNGHFSIGGVKTGAGFTNHFAGMVDEIRVWNLPRTNEEFTDNAFGRLKGEWELLLANYVFDNPMSKTGGFIQDSSINSVHLTVYGPTKLQEILSTAPISTEIPQVRSALTGVITEYHGTLSASPAVVEYGDVQKNDDGTLNGVLKRCYSFIENNGAWVRMTGYKVGNLVSQWFGQSQFAPQVMGYMEGGPPVPAENLILDSDSDADFFAYLLNNSVKFRQAEEVSYNYSTSKEAGWNVAVEHSTELGVNIDTLIAPLGFGISIEGSVFAKGESNWETSGKRSQSFERGTSLTTDRAFSASLTGFDGGAGGSVPRNYQLGNIGFALVKSKTADVYLLRLAHNDALISIFWQPNADIPEDVNIIPFPINPLYTKQGTLDGKCADKTDVHYPQAQGAYGQYSYFKPREAYKLKQRIDREKLELKAYYEDAFDVSKTNAHFKAAASTTGLLQVLGANPGWGGGLLTSGINQILGQVATQVGYNNTKLRDDLAKMGSQRNLVNTYVWTIEGGFFAETTEVAETQQETYSNDTSLALSGKLGYGTEIEGGIHLNHSSLFASGSSFTLTKSKTKASNTSFGLDVSLSLPTSPRYKYAGIDKLSLSGGVIKDGTVDAYRFMSFYLEPSGENYVDLFTKVIDPIWLEENPDPNAMALRQARGDQDKQKPCWRVMHRVTFVSRVLPEFKPEAPPSLERSMQVSGIESNYMLIKRFEPYLANITHQGDFFSKIDTIIDTQMLELRPYKMQVKRYLAQYFNLDQL